MKRKVTAMVLFFVFAVSKAQNSLEITEQQLPYNQMAQIGRFG